MNPMTALERFLKYIRYDTQSVEESQSTPSSDKQRLLGSYLAQELRELGLENAHLAENGAVYAWLPATPGREDLPVIALLAHMDTAPRVPGGPVKARLVPYTGGEIVLNQEKGIVMTPEEFPDLLDQVGQTLVVTDGTTLLGADDKAGIAEIFAAVEVLCRNPKRPHGRVALCVTPDEEVGRGADYVDLKKLGADFGYTVDGGLLGTLEYENFYAASAKVTFHGVNIHPGEGKGKLRNACLMASQFVSLVPPAEDPAHTAGYEGFYHLCTMAGDESQAELAWILRDHDRETFAARKETFRQITTFLCQRYGPGTVELTLTDSYYNMKEKILPHPQLLTWAREAFRKVGVEPRDVPIRGGTDGAQLSWRGLPCPNLSTGGGHFHGVYEYIPTRSLEKMTEMLVELLTGIDETKK